MFHVIGVLCMHVLLIILIWYSTGYWFLKYISGKDFFSLVFWCYCSYHLFTNDMRCFSEWKCQYIYNV